MRVKNASCIAMAMTVALLGGMIAAAQDPGGLGVSPAVAVQAPGDVGPGSAVIINRQPPFRGAFRFRNIHGRWWNNPRIVTELKLTDDQRKAMDQILFQHREQLIDLQANLEKAELGMQPLMNADQPNQAAIDAQIDKVVAARGDLERADAHFLLALRMKLTPDQWKQLQADRAKRRTMEVMPGEQRRNWGPRGPNWQNPPPTPPVAPTPPQGGAAPGTGAEQ
jgi:Spy/CpxP family protein refolding chaperone